MSGSRSESLSDRLSTLFYEPLPCEYAVSAGLSHMCSLALILVHFHSRSMVVWSEVQLPTAGTGAAAVARSENIKEVGKLLSPI